MERKGETPGGGASTLAAGMRHLKAEYGRWWRAEDLSDTHIAHRILNDQYRLWKAQRQRVAAEVQQNMALLKNQQKQATFAQMQRIQMQKRSRGYGYGYGGGMGASPMISYRMMQWAQLQIRLGQEDFHHLEVTDAMLAIGRGQVRSRRHLVAALWLLVLMAVWLGLWWLSALAGVVVTLGPAAVLVALAWTQGRRPTRRRPPVPKLMFVPPKVPAHADVDPEPDPEPFPIREAGHSPREARQSVRLALKKEGAPVEVKVPAETDWGWSVPLVLNSGTLGDLVRLLPGVATTLRVGQNRLLAQLPDPEDSAAVTLRVLTSDPFASTGPYPVLPPRSRSITEPHSIGRSIDGDPTDVVLAGQHVLIVANSGGGKSTMVRALAEHVTACTDAVAVDIDPMGRGLGPLRPCAARTAYTEEAIERTLEDLLRRARARIASLGDTADNWPVSDNNPAIIAFIDEYRRLSPRAKKLVLDLLTVGRKARITAVLCTTDATSDALGDAIADAIGVRILMPCRSADVPLVVGRSDAIAQGWLPHLLVPSPGEWEPADAGRYYCITPRHRTPVLRYVPELPPVRAAEAARERVAAGLPAMPDDAIPAAPNAPAARPFDAASAPAIARLLLGAFGAAGNPEWLTMAQLAQHLAAEDPDVWGRWDGRRDRLLMVGRTLTAELNREGLTIPRTRLESDADPARPTVIRLADVLAALA
ncbi:ATP-binding protein [Streptomyces sp. NPDC059649]|uniref:ATP-binding protein n=1 Tax=Streptomyces sp. NPDC059649 TaxID=3346895 RepID=UPI0036A39329